MLFNTRSDDRSLHTPRKILHHPHPHHILAPPSPSGPRLRAPLPASSQVLPQYVVYLFRLDPASHTLICVHDRTLSP